MITGMRRRQALSTTDASWPGFVDALSTLLLVIIFMLSMFVLAQFFLGQALTGRDQALADLQEQLAEMGDLLKVEQRANEALRTSVADLSSALSVANAERDSLSSALRDAEAALSTSTEQLASLSSLSDSLRAEVETLRREYAAAQSGLADEQRLSASALTEVQSLRASVVALRQQLARLQAALEASEERDRRNRAVIVDLGRRLNRALAAKVEELAGYRSEFFGRLKEVLARRAEVRIEGDRFVFASELLFESGSAELGPEGRAELGAFAETLLTIAADIPRDLNWILRVDGHTDRRPISTARFGSNWDLSTARATAVVEYLITRGVQPANLAAAGFGEHQPLDPANTEVAFARNRRIELRLTQR